MRNRSETKAPSLVVSVKPVAAEKYEVSIAHPNTKKVLFIEVFAGNAMAAFSYAKHIRDTRFSDVKTKYDPPKEIRKRR